jgi:chromosome segregation ATPase
MGPITTPLSPATQSDILGILQREQDHAVSLLTLSPLLSSLFISYANRAAALESASATPSPECEEWKSLQTNIAMLREENEKLKLENREMAGGLEAAEASQEAFRSQVLSLKEVNTTQQDNIKSLRAELVEARDKYDRLVMDSNAERAAFQIRALDLEVRLGSCPIMDRTWLFMRILWIGTTGRAERGRC